MEAFLEAQTQFLQQQLKFAEEEEQRKKGIHFAQLKELEDRSKLLKLQEKQNAEARARKEKEEMMKWKLKQAD